jgi:hypothetical protein
MKRTVTILILCLILTLALPIFAAGASAESSELFSARDLSASYDEEVFSITLSGNTASTDSDHVTVSGGTVTVNGPGTYLVSGTLDNGGIVVNADKQDKVQLVLNDVSISSDTGAAIYVAQADKVFVTLAEGTSSTLTNGGRFAQDADGEIDAVIYAKDDLTLNGSGSLTINSLAGHGIVGKDDVTVTGGSYAITSPDSAMTANDTLAVAGGSFQITTNKDGLHSENSDDDTLGAIYITGGSFVIRAGDDAVHAESLLQIDGGSLDITAAEGLEATYIHINDGQINISATDDGLNAARKSSAYTPTVEISGGTLTVTMGPGDTDGIDSNGNLIITGGTVNVTAASAFDYDGTASFTGGTVIINGQQVDTLPNQMMGGRGGMMGGRGGMMGGRGGMMGDPDAMTGGPGMHERKSW